MQGRAVSWPTMGDTRTFRRRALVLCSAGAVVVLAPLVFATMANPSLLLPVLPLALGGGLLVALWSRRAARTHARRAELERSFAGLTVLHAGGAYAVAAHPVLGSYATRRDAATAALERGSWALVVRAWDRYWLLDAAPVRDHAPRTAPVSFRTRAVADVIPAIRGEAIA